MRHLEGRTAIITGGGRGIGRAVAEALAAGGAGIVIAARNQRELRATAAAVGAAGGRAEVVAGDIADPPTSQRLLETALGSFGGCDVLINAAAIVGPTGETETLDLEAWSETLRINLTGTFLACRAVLPEMKRRRRGKILNIASGLAVRPQPGLAAYSATKAAVVQFSRVLAEEVRSHGISVNAVHPGIVRTAQVDELMALGGPGAQQQIVQRMKEVEAAGALREPAEAARLFVWLAAACELTGAFIRSDDPEVQAQVAAFVL
ncbi:MAG: SDR family NAD(P)-dependent oxidoreductase [Geminicoccaceae bacterium]